MMYSGLFMKTLKGSRGWSHLQLEQIDISRVIDVNYRKRTFCIFDRDRPYTLDIKYHYPKDEIKINPIIGGKGGFVVSESVKNDHMITRRFRTESEVIAEVKEIRDYQEQVEKLKEMYKNELLSKLKNELGRS